MTTVISYHTTDNCIQMKLILSLVLLPLVISEDPPPPDLPKPRLVITGNRTFVEASPAMLGGD